MTSEKQKLEKLAKLVEATAEGKSYNTGATELLLSSTPTEITRAVFKAAVQRCKDESRKPFEPHPAWDDTKRGISHHDICMSMVTRTYYRRLAHQVKLLHFPEAKIYGVTIKE